MITGQSVNNCLVFNVVEFYAIQCFVQRFILRRAQALPIFLLCIKDPDCFKVDPLTLTQTMDSVISFRELFCKLFEELVECQINLA
jgi:hypothetical protein